MAEVLKNPTVTKQQNIMKRLMFYALMMQLALGMASFASCSNDNYQNNDQDSKPDSTKIDSVREVTAYDQVKYLQNNIIEVDSLDNMVQRVSGVRLNNADSTELTVGVDNIDEATKIFKSWLSPDTKTETISPSTVDLKADLADEDGKVKETVYFKAVAGNGDEIAEMTFKNGGVLKHFTKVKFAHPESLGLNSHSPYEVGEREEYDTYGEGKQKWVCVKEAKNGIAGLMVYISKSCQRWNQFDAEPFATISMAKAVSEAIRADNKWDTFVKYFKEAGQDRLNAGEYYWTSNWYFYGVGKGMYAVRLSDGDPKGFETFWVRPKKHFIQVRTFGLVN